MANQIEVQDCLDFAHTHCRRISATQEQQLKILIAERGCPEIMGFMTAMLNSAEQFAKQVGSRTKNPLAWELRLFHLTFVGALEANIVAHELSGGTDPAYEMLHGKYAKETQRVINDLIR